VLYYNGKKHIVYALVDDGNIARYVGHTNNLEVRAIAHSNNIYKAPLEMRIISDKLNYFEARGVEQNLIEYCHVLNKGDLMYNQRNGIRYGTDNYYNFTRMGSIAFDNTIIPIQGDKCYIDSNIYPAVK